MMEKREYCISLWVLAGFILCVCTPIIIYGMIRFLRHKTEIPIKLRDPWITILIVILFLLRIIGKSVLNAYNCNFIMDELIQDIILPPLLWIPCCLLAYRFRMIHDRINYIFDISTLSWKNILTNNNIDGKPWDNKNYKYTFAIYAIYCIFGCIAQLIKTLIMHKNNVTDDELLTAVLLIPVLLNIVYMKCGYASPMIRDIYFVKWEEGYITIFGTFYLVSFIAVNLVARLNDNLKGLFTVIEIACTDIALKLVCVVMTCGVCTKISKIIYTKRTALGNQNLTSQTKLQRKASTLDEFMFVESNIQAKKHPKSDILPCMDKETVFKTILNDNDGLQFYCEHLFSEYTIENFVSFIELHQWLTVYDINDDYSTATDDDTNLDQILFHTKANNNTMKDYYNFEFSNEIPTSYINNHNELTWFDKIKALNDKYVSQYCELQINVPYSIRNKFETFINLYQFKLDNPGTINSDPDSKRDFETDLVILDTFTNPRNALTSAPSVRAINKKISPMPSSKSLGLDANVNKHATIIGIETIEPSESFQDETVTIGELPSTQRVNTEQFSDKKETSVVASLELPKFVCGIKSANMAVGNNNPLRLQFNQGAISSPIAIYSPPNKDGLELKYNDPSETLLSNTIKKTSTRSIFKNHASTSKRGNQARLNKDIISKKSTLSSNVKALKSILKYGFKSGSNMMKKRKRKGTEMEIIIQKIEDAKLIDINSFIAVVKETIHVLIKLNYQSISRFMKTKDYERWYTIQGKRLTHHKVNIPKKL